MRTNPMLRFSTLAVALALSLALPGCKKESEVAPAEATPAQAEEAAPSAIKLDPAALQSAGIKLETLRPSSLSEQLRAPGEVIDNSYNTTLITPRVESLIVRRHAKLGDEVRAGAPLVTLASVDVSDAQADLRIAEQEYRRMAALGPEAVAGRRIMEARVALDRARAKAQAYGLPGTATGTVNGQFTLTAPHAGRITEDSFVVGERVEPGKALYRLVEESTVWVDARLPAGSVARIESGRAATVLFNGQRLPGTVLLSAHRTSDATRNATVRVEVANKGDTLHGGDFVEVFFDAGSNASVGNRSVTELTVPSDALVQLQGETVVFRRNATGALEPVPVRVGEAIGDRTIVREGLKAGDVVVATGAFTLKSQMLKSQLGEDE
ncbi:efflux RND transporter periplasmic adaptor subunit [Cognatilysobacter terrigena]|uniref:efflux RND transporter periplasmic adaptor subunit n=1 Tax=Cognatilysobacter terrigena TaxID=2488749 RepID=UPI0010611536|nr:efflux RND transporter periplasmic adaptor subunit [Lysobacter terrigena]